MEGAVHESYVRPAILYGCESWCLEGSEIGIFQRTKRSMVRAMCGVQHNDAERSADLVFMLGLNEPIDKLAMANSVRCYGHVLRRALDFNVEGEWKKGRTKRTWKNLVEEESVKVGLRREDGLCRSKWSGGVNKIAAGLR